MSLIPYQIIPGSGTGITEPAETIAALLNGPGHRTIYVPLAPASVRQALGYYDDRLVGIVIFWFLIGLAIDRKREGRDLGRDYPEIVLPIFVLAAIWCAGWAGTVAYGVFKMDEIYWQLIWKYPLRITKTEFMGLGIWYLFLFLYFVRRSIQAARHWRREVVARTRTTVPG